MRNVADALPAAKQALEHLQCEHFVLTVKVYVCAGLTIEDGEAFAEAFRAAYGAYAENV